MNRPSSSSANSLPPPEHMRTRTSSRWVLDRFQQGVSWDGTNYITSSIRTYYCPSREEVNEKAKNSRQVQLDVAEPLQVVVYHAGQFPGASDNSSGLHCAGPKKNEKPLTQKQSKKASKAEKKAAKAVKKAAKAVKKTKNLESKTPNYIPKKLQAKNLRHHAKFLLLGSPTITKEEIVGKTRSVLENLFICESIIEELLEDAVMDLKVWLHPDTVPKFIYECMMQALVFNKKERRAVGLLIREMLMRKHFAIYQVRSGFELMLQKSKNFLVEVPKVWEYLADMIEPIFEGGVVSLRFLQGFSRILGPSSANEFVAAILMELVNAPGGAARAEGEWIMAQTSLDEILPGVDVDAFVDQHKELEFVKLNFTSTRGNGSMKFRVTEKPNIGRQSPAAAILFQRHLEHLIGSEQNLADDICTWMQNKSEQIGNHLFFRQALGNAFKNRCINGRGASAKVNKFILLDYCKLLKNFFGTEEKLISAIHSFVLEYPKGLIHEVMETLIEEDVVTVKGLESWFLETGGEDQAVRAVKSIASFMITKLIIKADD